MKAKKLCIFILCMIFLVGSVSAFEFDNIKSYDEIKKEVVITNAFGLGDELYRARLISPSNVYVIRGEDRLVAEVTVSNFIGSGSLFDEMSFFNINKDMKKFNRDFTYKYKTSDLVSVPDYYEIVCSPIVLKNGTKSEECNNVGVNFHLEERNIQWHNLDTKELLKGDVTIGIFTDVLPNEHIEWIPKIFGKEIDEWSTWTESLNVELTTYYDFESGEGTNIVDRVDWTANGTFHNAVAADWVNGIIGNGTQLRNNGNEYINLSEGISKIDNFFGADTAGSYSISFWVYSTAYESNYESIIGRGQAVDGVFNIDITGNPDGTAGKSFSMMVIRKNGDDTENDMCFFESATNLTFLNKWTHYVVTFEGRGTANMKLYADNNLIPCTSHVNTLSSNIDLTGNATEIGGGSNPYNGKIDEIGIWNRILTAAEVEQLYNDGSGITYKSSVLLTVNLNNPVDNYNTSSNTVNFNCNATDNVGVLNLTLVINEEDNYTIENSSAGQNLSIDINRNLPDGDYNWTCYAHDEDRRQNATETRELIVDASSPAINLTYPRGMINYFASGSNLSLNWTVPDTHLDSCWYDYNGTNVSVTCLSNHTEINITSYSNRNLTFYANDTFGNDASNFTSWEHKVFQNNVTYSPSTYELTKETYAVDLTANSSLTGVTLVYNGTEYSTTLSGTTWSRDLTLSSVGNKTVYWNFTYAGDVISSDKYAQTVNRVTLILCNSTYGVSFLNFTFKNEADSSVMNASNDLTDFTYWLDSSSITKSYITSNSTETLSYAFCFDPPDKTLNVDLTFKYSASGYPIRTFTYSDKALTNATTNQILYLLGTSDGIYSSIQVIETTGTPISDVEITIERQFDGIWTLVGQGTTGSDGLVTFWVNPNFPHRITAIKTGYAGGSATITPSQSTYTLTLARSAGDAEFTSSLEGLSWKVTPPSGYLPAGIHNFYFNLTASLLNLESCKFELVDIDSSAIVASTTGGSSGGCNLSLTYTISSGQWVYGKLYVDTTNTTGYILIDSDLRWGDIEGHDKSTWRSIFSFFDELKDLDEWGTCEDSGTTCHRAEFSRIVAFFIFLAIIIGVFSYFTLVDTSYPGASNILILIIITFASFAGWFTLSIGTNQFSFIQKYIVGLICLFITSGWILNYFARNT